MSEHSAIWWVLLMVGKQSYKLYSSRLGRNLGSSPRLTTTEIVFYLQKLKSSQSVPLGWMNKADKICEYGEIGKRRGRSSSERNLGSNPNAHTNFPWTPKEQVIETTTLGNSRMG